MRVLHTLTPSPPSHTCTHTLLLLLVSLPLTTGVAGCGSSDVGHQGGGGGGLVACMPFFLGGAPASNVDLVMSAR